MHASPMRRQVLILASAQAIYQTATVLVMTVGGLAGAQLAASPGLATLPIETMFLGTALTTFPASLWMARVGRRTGFVAGALLGVIAGCLAALGVWLGSMALLCLGTFFVGGYQAFAQFYRFAASEVASPEYRPRAISFVLAGGVAAAITGPLLARLGGAAFDQLYVGSFLLLALTSLIGAGVLLNLRVPPPSHLSEQDSGARRLGVIVRQPGYVVALFAAATGYGVMILAMSATPLAMVEHHHSLSSAATVIQFHVLAMFLPSFFTGSLIARFGVHAVMLASVSGTGIGSFASATVLLGWAGTSCSWAEPLC